MKNIRSIYINSIILAFIALNLLQSAAFGLHTVRIWNQDGLQLHSLVENDSEEQLAAKLESEMSGSLESADSDPEIFRKLATLLKTWPNASSWRKKLTFRKTAAGFLLSFHQGSEARISTEFSTIQEFLEENASTIFSEVSDRTEAIERNDDEFLEVVLESYDESSRRNNSDRLLNAVHEYGRFHPNRYGRANIMNDAWPSILGSIPRFEFIDFIDEPTNPKATVRPAACKGCSAYHGSTYNDVLLNCAIHPEGPLKDSCADFEN